MEAVTQPDAYLSSQMRHDIERAKWHLWHGRWKGCLIKLAAIRRGTEAKNICQVAGAEVLRRHLDDLPAYLEGNQTGLVDYGARRRRGEPWPPRPQHGRADQALRDGDTNQPDQGPDRRRVGVVLVIGGPVWPKPAGLKQVMWESGRGRSGRAR